jgi:site-specific DNA recombinase
MWKMQTLRRMLMSPRISGQREHRGEIVGPAEWPAIITEADGERD